MRSEARQRDDEASCIDHDNLVGEVSILRIPAPQSIKSLLSTRTVLAGLGNQSIREIAGNEANASVQNIDDQKDEDLGCLTTV